MSASYEPRALSIEYEITVLCLVAVFDVLFEVVLWLDALDTIASNPVGSNLVASNPNVALIPLALASGKFIVLYGLTNGLTWGYRWAIGVYAFGLLVDLGTHQVIGAAFNAVILVWLLSEADYFR